MEPSPKPMHLTPDETAIRALEGEYDHSWNSGDVDALLACLTEDAVIVDPRGTVTRGHMEIRRLLSPLLGQPGSPSTHNSEIVRVAFVTSQVAIVDGHASIEGLALGANQDTPFLFHRFTDVVVRHEGQWKIAHIRACPFQPAAARGTS
jgi:uncharacterized protein (TIGR02246 family)